MLSRRAAAAPPGTAAVARALARLALFRADGIATFDAGTPGVLSSLAPLLALPLVIGLLSIVAPRAGLRLADDLTQMLTLVVVLLAPLVISHAIAVRWARTAEWPRYAAAFDWCQWVMPVAALAVMVAADGLAMLGLPARIAVWGGVSVLLAYGLALHWFVARHGLAVSPARATGLVLATNCGAALLVLVPALLQRALAGPTP